MGAFDNNRLIGIATFMRETGRKERHKGHILGVYVTPSHRRKGIAEALMSALLAKAKRDHPSLEQFVLTVTGRKRRRRTALSADGLYRLRHRAAVPESRRAEFVDPKTI